MTYSDDIIKKAIDLQQQGVSSIDIINELKISKSTFYNWMKKNNIDLKKSIKTTKYINEEKNIHIIKNKNNNTNDEHKINNLILKIIDELCPSQRKRTYTNKYYLDFINKVLKTGTQWNKLDCDCHFTSIYKTFCKWTNAGVFEKAYEKLKNIYLSNNNIIKIYSILSIDAAIIKNNKGSDKIGYHPKEKSKKGTKISLIIDTTSQRFPLALSINSGNVHDSKEIIPCLDNLPSQIINDRRHIKQIVADKGYLIDDDNKSLIRSKYRVKITTPPKKNAKNKYLHSRDKQALGKRNKIESVFSWLKQNRRIALRYEKKSNYFVSFVQLAIINQNKNVMRDI